MGRKKFGDAASADAGTAQTMPTKQAVVSAKPASANGAEAGKGGKSAKPRPEPKRSKIFLKNLAADTTSMDLEELFSDVGPIRRAFVITKKGERKCSGQGFVQFVTEADATTAMRRYNGKPFKGNRILIEIAKPRVREESTETKKQPQVKEEKDENNHKDDGYDITKEEEIGKNAPSQPQQPIAPPAPKKTAPVFQPKKREQPVLVRKVVIVSGLPQKADDKALEKVMRKYGPIVGITYPLGKENAVIAHVEYKEAKAAEKASKKCVNIDFQGRKISASFKPEKKDGRLIIRNLSFQATEADLSEKFATYGKLVDVVVVKHKDTGKPRGFGFVEFYNREEAANAVQSLNAQPIRDRKVAVDFCLARESYVKHVIEEETKSKSTPGKNSSDKNTKVKKEVKEEESDDSEEEESEEDDSTKAKLKSDKEDDDEEDDDDSEEELEEDAEAESADEMEEDESIEDQNDDRDLGDEKNELATDSADHEEGKEDADGDTSKERKRKRTAMDVKEGTTLFIRNLPFGVTPVDIRQKFSEFGRITYCALVKDKLTGMPRGSAFLQFKDKTSADSLLAQVALYTSQFAEAAAAAEETATTANKNPAASSSSSHNKAVLSTTVGKSGIFMEGRELIIDRAVDRDTAVNQFTVEKKKEKEEHDKRNLYLANEGYISPEMGDQMGLSKQDIMRREDAMRAKKQKLKNPNFFVSKTRLSVRNLPKSVDDKKLKKIFVEAVLASPAAAEEGFNKQIRIKQVKIVASEDGISKGFGFVEFVDHEHALAALREVNNSPKYFGEKKRPFVEFALEDKRVVESREKRLQIQKLKLKKLKELDDKEAREGGGKKKGKGKDTQQNNAKSSAVQKQEQKQGGQKRKREENTQTKKQKGAATQNGPNKPSARQQKKQRTEGAEQPSNPRGQRKRNQPEESTKTLSRKEKKEAKKRRDVDTLDAMVNQYKQRLFSDTAGGEASKRWFE